MAGHLERIKTFIAVANAQSFSAAARLQNNSSSAVTRHIAELEETLGVQLFVRTTRKVSLTQAGVQYFEKVHPLVSGIAAADDTARAYQEALSGRLQISCPLSFGTRFLVEPLTEFASLHPGIDLKINLTDSFVDIIRDDYDMALRISAAPADKSTIWRKIRPVPRCLVAAPGYLETAAGLAAPSDLQNHRCLGYSNQSEGGVWQLAGTSENTMRPVRLPSGFACNNGDLIAQMAIAGQGIALLPRFIVQDAIEKNLLTEVLTDWQAPEIWLTAFYPPYQKLPLAIDQFTEVFERHAGRFAL
ncbi:LysR family transcriptional regulator [Roseobacter sp. YSTF-M11]|uniref:LysR family transcriptional regulator n=1 Tax=Roseobacter insulae TaxID=2859783 RepID=A0A9X1FXB0_9RHOB|nr:LysR family transcriptional regulator [Roseobacter insulae]MBW4708962.1 LysR family transcriptional regulator [Roseobacter insulae]